MEPLRHSLVEVRVVGAKDNSHGAPKLLEFGDDFGTGPYGWQQILIQSEEGRPRAWVGVELLIQERQKMISDISIPKESTEMGIRFTQVNATYWGSPFPASATCCSHLSQADTHLYRFATNTCGGK